MRKSLILLPLLVGATPAIAQPAPPPPPPYVDPAIADRLADTALALSRALLDIRVGELKAATEGREATPAEKRMTVRDLASGGDPAFEARLQRKIAEARPKLRQGMKALNETLPAVMQDLERAQKSIDRALANLPDPTYPQR